MVLLHLASSEAENRSEPFDGFNERYQDCSHVFENRVVHFEYMYYPSYWVYPNVGSFVRLYWATLADVKSYGSSASYAKWIALPHRNKRGLALETMAPGWDNYFLVRQDGWENMRAWISVVKYTSHIRDLNNATSTWNIYCTNQCKPDDMEKDLFDKCILSQGGFWHYHEENGYSVFGKGQFNEDWLRYRIYAPKTETYFEEVANIDNCDGDGPLPASYKARSQVSITSSTSHTVSSQQTATWGLPFKETLLPSDIIADFSF